MNHSIHASIAILCTGLIQTAHAQKTEFWMSNGATSVASFMAYKDKIDIISPTWYQIDQGVCAWVLGEEDPAIWDAIPARR
jgi:hypothetical protein